MVSIFANGVSAAINGDFDYRDAFLLAASSVLTATISCFILGNFLFCYVLLVLIRCFFSDFVLIAVVFLTNRLHMNPDNLATPLAASIGDIVSLVLLSSVASLLFQIHGMHFFFVIHI